MAVTHLILNGNGNFNRNVLHLQGTVRDGKQARGKGAWSSLKISQRHAVHMAKRRGRSSARESSVPNNNWRKNFDGRARENGEENVPTVAVIQPEKKIAQLLSRLLSLLCTPIDLLKKNSRSRLLSRRVGNDIGAFAIMQVGSEKSGDHSTSKRRRRCYWRHDSRKVASLSKL